MQDAVLERLALQKWGDLAKVPYGTPERGREGSPRWHSTTSEQADRVTVAFRESDPPTRSTKRLTIVYRDRDAEWSRRDAEDDLRAGIEPQDRIRAWHQGAFGIGGASTTGMPGGRARDRGRPEMQPGRGPHRRRGGAVGERTAKASRPTTSSTTDWADGDNADRGALVGAGDRVSRSSSRERTWRCCPTASRASIGPAPVTSAPSTWCSTRGF